MFENKTNKAANAFLKVFCDDDQLQEDDVTVGNGIVLKAAMLSTYENSSWVGEYYINYHLDKWG